MSKLPNSIEDYVQSFLEMLCFVVTTLSCKYEGPNSSLSVDVKQHKLGFKGLKVMQDRPKLDLTIVK
jgi:hypothetical protein